MAFAGEIAEVGKIPGERIATTIETTDSGTFTTTETVVMSVTAALVTGRVYRVVFDTCIESSIADQRIIVRVRENALGGTVIQQRNVWIPFTGSIGVPVHSSVEFTGAADGNKTFVLTAVRATASGNINMSAETITPAYFYVDYVRG